MKKCSLLKLKVFIKSLILTPQNHSLPRELRSWCATGTGTSDPESRHHSLFILLQQHQHGLVCLQTLAEDGGAQVLLLKVVLLEYIVIESRLQEQYNVVLTREFSRVFLALGEFIFDEFN